MRPSHDLDSLPGAELVLAGLADLRAGRDTANALAVRMAATRLRAAGLEVPGHQGAEPAAHLLYAKLAHVDAGAAHSRYNAIIRRLVSFARAAEHAQAR